MLERTNIPLAESPSSSVAAEDLDEDTHTFQHNSNHRSRTGHRGSSRTAQLVLEIPVQLSAVVTSNRAGRRWDAFVLFAVPVRPPNINHQLQNMAQIWVGLGGKERIALIHQTNLNILLLIHRDL